MSSISIETICRAIRELDYQCEILAAQHAGRDEILEKFKCNADALREVVAEAERLEPTRPAPADEEIGLSEVTP